MTEQFKIWYFFCEQNKFVTRVCETENNSSSNVADIFQNLSAKWQLIGQVNFIYNFV